MNLFFERWFPIVVLVVLLGILSLYRFSGLTVSPPGFYTDEASMTLDGYSLAWTARDQHGILLPVFLKSFGDWKSPIFAYSQVPLFWVMDYSIHTTRVTAAVWGMLTIFVFGYWIWLTFRSWWVVTIGTLIMGTMPWLFQYSRVAFDLDVLPFFVGLYFVCLTKYLQTRRLQWHYGANLTLSLIFYTYAAGKFYSLWFLGLHWFLFIRQLSIKNQVRLLSVFGIGLLPAVYGWWQTPDAFSARMSVVSIRSQVHSWPELLVVYAKGYLLHFDPRFLFMKGVYNLRLSTQYHFPLLWVTAPILIAGLVEAFRKFRNPLYQLLLLHVITFPIISAYTLEAPHVHRTVQVIPVLGYLMVLGGVKFYKWMSEWHWVRIGGESLAVVLVSGWLMIFIQEWQSFYSNYQTVYRHHAEPWFLVEGNQALEALLHYPVPHIISWGVSEYQASNYQVLRRLPPEELQGSTHDYETLNVRTLKDPKTGHYVMNKSECQDFTQRFPQAAIVQWSNTSFCILEVK